MQNRGLGRGLAALISETQPADAGAQVREIPLQEIVANPYQPRSLFDPIKMEELVESVKAHGVLQPILVRRTGHERYELIAGERRYRAAQAAGLTAIPALIREIDERSQLEMAVVENVQREDIGPMEAARAYHRLIKEFGMTQDTVAQRIGKSRSVVANTLRFLHLPEGIQLGLEQGKLTEAHARALLPLEEFDKMLRAYQKLLEDGLTVRETDQLVKEMLKRQVSPPINAFFEDSAEGRSQTDAENASPDFLPVDPNESAALDMLRQALGTKVSIRRSSGNRGRIEIEFYSAHDLERLIEILTKGRAEA